MDESTRKEVFNRIDALAEKLNTTGEQLWSVLVAQAGVEVVWHTLGIAAGIALLAGTAISARKLHRYLIKSGGYDEWFGFHILFGLFGLVGLFLLIVNVGGLLTPLLNPQYWALHRILELL